MEGSRKLGMGAVDSSRQLCDVATELEICECQALPDGRFGVVSISNLVDASVHSCLCSLVHSLIGGESMIHIPLHHTCTCRQQARYPSR